MKVVVETLPQGQIEISQIHTTNIVAFRTGDGVWVCTEIGVDGQWYYAFICMTDSKRQPAFGCGNYTGSVKKAITRKDLFCFEDLNDFCDAIVNNKF